MRSWPLPGPGSPSLSLCLSGVRYLLQTVLMWWFWKCCCSRLYADGCCTGRRNSSNDTNEHHELNLKLQLPSLHTVQVYPARLLLSSFYHICLCLWSMLICVLTHTHQKMTETAVTSISLNSSLLPLKTPHICVFDVTAVIQTGHVWFNNTFTGNVISAPCWSQVSITLHFFS